jgi:glycosyltransferase involved in cell wall biosynthesis
MPWQWLLMTTILTGRRLRMMVCISCKLHWKPPSPAMYCYEHIFIDNASTDNTVDILRQLAARDKSLKVIVNARNFGHLRSPQHAILCAKGDAVAMLLSDLQDPPELIGEMIQEWEQGIPIVVGIKNVSDESGLMYKVRTLYYRIVGNLTNINVFEHFTGFGLYDRKVIDILRTRFPDPYPYFRGMIAEIGLPHKLLYYHLSNLFRNVPFLTSLEMSLFLLICLLSLGCPPERSPAPRFVRRV